MKQLIIDEVKKLLENNCDGHDLSHVKRVCRLDLEFAKKENADIEIVWIAAMLHDVNDYKIFGAKSAKELTNANRILYKIDIDKDKKTSNNG